jgi:SAM-dependent methyltransferase
MLKSKQITHRRFLTDNPMEYQKAITAAKDYVGNMSPPEVDWLYRKPYDNRRGHPEYFLLMFDLLNLLRVMNIPAGGRILEIGSGPGWVTETLLMLGYQVDCLEPSEDLVEIARQRCDLVKNYYRSEPAPAVRFHTTTLEDVEFEDESFEAVLFYDVLHHVVDEKVAIEKSFRFLVQGGVIGVVEGAWHPDFKELEAMLIDEMQRFGTLENPFTQDYLDQLLLDAGFEDITRYVGVNGYFEADALHKPLKEFADRTHEQTNQLRARRPIKGTPSARNTEFRTDADIEVVAARFDTEARALHAQVNLKNTGETRWESDRKKPGHIVLALRRGMPGEDAFLEAPERLDLPHDVEPGTSMDLQVNFTLPGDFDSSKWELDLVCEGYFWFSSIDVASGSVWPFDDVAR